ncbi:MAG: hypothetical protein ABIN97_07770 [Ginsengibacter sp.]
MIHEWVENNIAQAKHLHRLVLNSKYFESATEPMMSAICICYKGNGLSAKSLSKLHYEVAARIEKEGQFWFATTELKGKTYFRINPVNIYTTIETMEALFKTLQKYCKEAEDNLMKQ